MSRFWLDANVLIEANNRSYPINQALVFWQRLGALVDSGVLRCPRRVYREVAEQENHQDDVARWMKHRRNLGLCVLPSQAVTDLVGEIEMYIFDNSQYDQAENFVFCAGGDPWVIAHAKVEGGTVVTLETALRPNAKKPRVPDICKKYDVPCVTTLGMFSALEITF